VVLDVERNPKGWHGVLWHIKLQLQLRVAVAMAGWCLAAQQLLADCDSGLFRKCREVAA
jgi:hypothetical protein